MDNRRKSQRHDRRLAIEYAFLLAGGGEPTDEDWRWSVTRNLSLGGVFIEAEERPPYGSRVKVRFQLPNQEAPIEIGAAVRWTESGGFGVQFDGLRARDVWSLGKFLDQPQE